VEQAYLLYLQGATIPQVIKVTIQNHQDLAKAERFLILSFLPKAELPHPIGEAVLLWAIVLKQATCFPLLTLLEVNTLVELDKELFLVFLAIYFK
jgi:hypothetical protein